MTSDEPTCDRCGGAGPLHERFMWRGEFYLLSQLDHPQPGCTPGCERHCAECRRELRMHSALAVVGWVLVIGGVCFAVGLLI